MVGEGRCSYVTGFIGNDAKKRAIAYAAKNFAEFEVVEKPVPKREKLSRRGDAGLSEPTTAKASCKAGKHKKVVA
jgi:hypothetical protein